MNVGIVCEYNPLHLGHYKQLLKVREEFGPDCGIVCAMSGNYVQRGEPAVFDKSLRAAAAVDCGADLVLELPVTVCLSSAEGYASGAVKILAPLCEKLCFGTETGDAASLMSVAQALLNDGFPPLLRRELDTGKSFPAARQAALAQMGLEADILTAPNDILAVEYCKAILSQNLTMEPFPIRRTGSYHAHTPDPENPSATSLRREIAREQPWLDYIPENARHHLAHARSHTLALGEKAILARLRTMTEAEFSALPHGSEGLWRKLMHASSRERTLEDIFTTVKSKRYTHTRLSRMVMCACLGITGEDLTSPVPYIRVLAFNGRGREILNAAKKGLPFCNAGKAVDGPHWLLEQRCGDLYGLFASEPEAPGLESRRRVYYKP